jgi:hypothetical protein
LTTLVALDGRAYTGEFVTFGATFAFVFGLVTLAALGGRTDTGELVAGGTALTAAFKLTAFAANTYARKCITGCATFTVIFKLAALIASRGRTSTGISATPITSHFNNIVYA